MKKSESKLNHLFRQGKEFDVLHFCSQFFFHILSKEPESSSVFEMLNLETINHQHTKKQIKKLRHASKKSEKVIKEYHTCPEFTEVGIPPFLQNSYLMGTPPPRITSLRPWQKDLLSRPEWREEKRSAIVLVPTSGGKTLAADVAIAQQLEMDDSSKIIFALPFVSLASEKTNEYRNRFPNFSVRPFYQNIGGPNLYRGSIAICTYEKVHSLLNSAIKDNYINRFQLLIIDEIHMIGESQRGAVIEAIIVKLLLLRPHVEIRILGLTATLNQADAIRLSEWINGFIYYCKSRPSRINHYYKAKNGDLFITAKGEKRRITTIQSIPEDTKHILFLIRNSLKRQPSSTILVFVNTRKQTVQVAEFIAKHLCDEIPQLPPLQPPDQHLIAARDFLLQRLSKTETGLDPHLGFCIRNGIAFHHAGMLLEERKIIEDAARDSIISVIVATTTLSAGINIRSVGRVIIYDIYRSLPNKQRLLIPSAVYTQMAGRAGRSENFGGDVFILSQYGDEKEMNDCLKLSEEVIDNIEPKLLEEGVSDRFFLQCLVSGLIEPTDGIHRFVDSCFESYTSRDQETNNQIADQIKQRLKNINLIENQEQPTTGNDNHLEIENEMVKPTPFGCAIAASSMSIEEGLELKESIDRLQENLCLQDDVHLLYLCIPPSAIQIQSTPDYENNIWMKLRAKHQKVFNLITQFDSNGFERHVVMTMRNGGKRNNVRTSAEMAIHDRELDRFFYACLLQKLIAEKPVNKIVEKFDVTRGSVQMLQMTAATFAGQSVRFCETTGCTTLSRALNTFRERLNFGVKNELLPLMKLPSCNRYTARILVANRIPSPIELSELSPEEIARFIATKRGSPAPSEKELELGNKLHEESRKIAQSLMILDEMDNKAFAKPLDFSFIRHS